MFDIPMNLHCSQTSICHTWHRCGFDIPMNLHCSQTIDKFRCQGHQFDIPMNLHCSQTRHMRGWRANRFDIPMNLHCSQTQKHALPFLSGLIFLWIYTALKHGRETAFGGTGLIFLWIYTALKLTARIAMFNCSLIFLWIYTALKLDASGLSLVSVWYSYEFTLLSNYPLKLPCRYKFDIPMNLHCSQTSQTRLWQRQRLIFLWIYTALKHHSWWFVKNSVWYSYEFTLLSNE